MEHFEGLLIASMAAYEVPGECIARCRSILAAAWKAALEEAKFCRDREYRCGCPAIMSDAIKAFCSTHLEVLKDAPDASAASSGAIGAGMGPNAAETILDAFERQVGLPLPSKVSDGATGGSV